MSGAGEGHWFEGLADHMGQAYLRYSFTKGTENEVAFLVDVLDLRPGDRVLDVGCGPGRHALALAERGMHVTGIDISQRFVDIAGTTAAARGLDGTAAEDRGITGTTALDRGLDGTAPEDRGIAGTTAADRGRNGAAAGSACFVRADARTLDFDGEFDAVISLCQGAFGLSDGPAADRVDPDAAVLASIARAVKPGGHIALSAFSAYFAVRYLEAGDTFDAATGVNHERTTIRSETGEETETDLWTTCFTPRELRLLAASAGLEAQHLWSVAPGRYAKAAPDLDHPEFLLVAFRRS